MPQDGSKRPEETADHTPLNLFQMNVLLATRSFWQLIYFKTMIERGDWLSRRIREHMGAYTYRETGKKNMYIEIHFLQYFQREKVLNKNQVIWCDSSKRASIAKQSEKRENAKDLILWGFLFSFWDTENMHSPALKYRVNYTIIEKSYRKKLHCEYLEALTNAYNIPVFSNKTLVTHTLAHYTNTPMQKKCLQQDLENAFFLLALTSM